LSNQGPEETALRIKIDGRAWESNPAAVFRRQHQGFEVRGRPFPNFLIKKGPDIFNEKRYL
jgi:hypothetical protein